MRKLLALTLIFAGAGLFAQNPVIRDQYSADPTARVFDGKVYLYPSHDIRSEKNPRGLDWFCMADYHVFSSDNLVDWRDHGVIVSQENVPWGNPEAYAMWAPDCVCKDGKYYFFFPDAPKEGFGFRVGVAVADKPEGPFVCQENYIEGVMGIDPCVLQCSNGDNYLIWSGMGLRAARLNDSMTGIEGEAVDLSATLPEGFKEGPFAFEKDGHYYLTYPYQFDGKNNGVESLVYAMSDNPMGPYEYKGVIMAESPTKCWTNHHSIVEYKGEWYLFYHHNDYSPDFDKNRSVRIDRINFNEDGTIQQVVPTLRGVGLSRADRPIHPDRYSEAAGVELEFVNPAKPFEGWFIRYCEKKQGWSSYKDVDFGFYTPSVMTLRVRSVKGGSLRVKCCGEELGVIDIPKKTLEWTEVQIPVTVELSGVKCLRFELVKGTVDLDVVNFSKFSAVNPPEGKSSEYCIPGAVYPCVDDEGRATFALNAPDAKEVAADIDGKVYPMTRDANGLWKVTTPPIRKGHQYYRLVVDGVRMNDPGVYTIYGAGSCFSQLEIPEDEVAGAYYRFDPSVPHGQVRECHYWSDIHKRMRRCFVYTPAEYEKSGSKKYPYFILQHGMAENETGWHEQGKMANIMDNAIASGAAVPMLVIMDNGDCDYGWGTKPGEGMEDFGASFENVVLDELIPFVESTFRVYDDRGHRAISGLSWGGHQAFEIGLKHVDKFSAIGAFSGAIFVFPGMDIDSLYGGVFKDPEKFNSDIPVLFMSNGTLEGLGGMALDKMFDEKGIHYTRYISEGTAHEWLTWRRSLNEFIRLIFK